MIVGILGGGQLGRMLALAGFPLALRCRFLDPSPTATAGRVGELVVGEYDEPAILARFAAGLTVATYEFENVPVGATRRLAERVPVYPPVRVLEIAQDRLVEKTFFRDLGIPVPPFAPVEGRGDLDAALAGMGFPAVLKTRRLGYDGKGQAVLRTPADADAALARLGGAPLILERLVAFERELSILALRGRDGHTAFYPLVETHHRDGLLRWTVAPAPRLTPALSARAERWARHVLEALAYVGLLAIELFQVGEELLVNEMAPRVHNSGHWTIEGAETSQFENHLRAVVGWPLGATAARGTSLMVNLVGRLPDSRRVLAVPGAHLHLYDKSPAPGRKLGHVTVRADLADALPDALARLLPITDGAQCLAGADAP